MSLQIEECIAEVLLHDAGVTALLAVQDDDGSSVLLPGHWQGKRGPYIVHHRIRAYPIQLIEGLDSNCAWEYQVKVFAATYLAARELGAAVRDAVVGVHLSSPAAWAFTAIWDDEFYLENPTVDQVGVHLFTEQFIVHGKL